MNFPIAQTELENIIEKTCLKVIDTCKKSKSGHIGGSLSLIQVITYFLIVLSKSDVDWKILLSKGHSSLGLYALLEELNLEVGLTNNYCSIPGGFHGHTCSKASKYIIASTGSLGHGLPLSAGFSYANKKAGKNILTLCVIGDGDLQEGSNLEVLHSLLKLKDCNLKIINDNNSSVDSGFIDVNRFYENLNASYHNLELIKTFDMSNFENHVNLSSWLLLPGLRIANCISKKGFGFKDMYSDPKWHAGIPNDEEYEHMLDTADFNLFS